jgi:hypothetical protein
MANGNIITNTGKKIALNRTFKSTPDYGIPSIFKIGIGTNTPSTTDTDIQTKIPITGTELVDNCDVTTGWTPNVDCTLTVNTTTYKEGAGALNFTKTGTATANANASKTTLSINFTNKEINLWVYIYDTTTLNKLSVSNCFQIQLGSDSSNYYYWNKNKPDFVVGWNYLSGLTTSTASGTTGSPVITAMNYTLIQLTATASGQTWSVGNIIVDIIQVAGSSSFIKSLLSGYPLLDESNLQVTNKALLALSEANNSFNISEFGMFNTDSPNKIFSRVVHTPILKTSGVQIIYVEKDKFV